MSNGQSARMAGKRRQNQPSDPPHVAAVDPCNRDSAVAPRGAHAGSVLFVCALFVSTLGSQRAEAADLRKANLVLLLQRRGKLVAEALVKAGLAGSGSAAAARSVGQQTTNFALVRKHLDSYLTDPTNWFIDACNSACVSPRGASMLLELPKESMAACFCAFLPSR